jgi:hypothetical protein
LGTGSTANFGGAAGHMAGLGFISFKDNNVLVAAVSCGAENSCARFANGKIFCWGRGSSGVNGQNTNTNIGDTQERSLDKFDPIVFKTEDPAVLLSLGYTHAYHLSYLFIIYLN